MAVFKTYLKTPLGKIRLLIDNNRVSGLNFTDSIKDENIKEDETEFSLSVKEQLKEYFNGIPVNLNNIPVKIDNCEFDQRIYQILLKTCFGETTTYGAIAKIYYNLYGKKISGQAVGSALSRNKILLIIPCHRVLRVDGTPGGFSSGFIRKKKLLEIEKNGN